MGKLPYDLFNQKDNEKMTKYADTPSFLPPAPRSALPAPCSKLKIATIVGTRPEIIRLSRVIAAMDQHFEHVLVHTGQNYDYELSEPLRKRRGWS
jgi:hypothetical protein